MRPSEAHALREDFTMRATLAMLAMLLAACTASAPTAQPTVTQAPIIGDASPSPSGTESSTAAARSPAPTAPGTIGQPGCSTPAVAFETGALTGVWDADDDGLYYLRQMDDCVWWFGTSLREVGEGNQDGFANVAVGRVAGDQLHLEWADVPLGGILGGGTLTLAISENGDELVKIAETGTGFGGAIWTRHVAGDASPSPDSSPGPS
jgi:hypothetical protein